MQNAEHHEVDHVAVGIADSDAQNRHGGKAQTRQHRVNEIQHRGDEQEQELDRLGRTADHAGDYARDQQPFNFMTILRARTVVHRQRRPR
ncbi:hypothetical protein D3C72_1989890 [compost metagenome]